jgi:type II secretory pathway predicted ATPase ExeA
MLTNYEYYTKFDWDFNPFTLKILPELMVGYQEQIDSLLSHIHNFHKFALITGPTGSGKTTLLTWLRAQSLAYKKFLPYYIPKPPKSSSNLVVLIKKLLGYNFLDSIRYRNLSIFELHKFIVGKTKDKHLVLLIDEAHETSISNLEWLRTIVDSTPNLSVIFAALPVFEKKIETKLSTLNMRFTTKVYLNSLNKTETESLILKRIESVGGDGLKPLSLESIDRIYEVTGGFPREIIKTCDLLIREASRNNVFVINKEFVDTVLKPKSVEKPEKLRITLTDKQNKILSTLNENPDLNPTEIVSHLETGSYKNKNNAIRSVNNILRRLLGDGMVERKKIKNTYLYSLSGKAKTIFTEA